MGLNDAAEMLEAAKADAVQLERDLALTHADLDREQTERLRLQRELAAASETIADQARRLQEAAGVIFQASEQVGTLWRERHDLEQQLEQVRRKVHEYDHDLSEAGTLAEWLLEIIEPQPSPSGDEHDRHA